jgi:hypothetical protein
MVHIIFPARFPTLSPTIKYAPIIYAVNTSANKTNPAPIPYGSLLYLNVSSIFACVISEMDYNIYDNSIFSLRPVFLGIILGGMRST